MLSYKAESAGMKVVKGDPQYTSMTCSDCGNVQEMPQEERTYICGRCGMQMDRDVNASINILKRGRAGLARTDAQGDICLCVPSGNASSVEKLRTYSTVSAEEAPTFR